MQVGCFGGLVFSVDSNKVFTMQDIQGSTGSDWATHNTINGKPKSELTGQKLKAYKFTVTLDAQYGVKPREMLANIQRMAEEGTVDYLIIGSDPVGMCLFKLTDASALLQVDGLSAAKSIYHLRNTHDFRRSKNSACILRHGRCRGYLRMPESTVLRTSRGTGS